MAAHGGFERRWSDLPGDLLAAVYLRFSSGYDRARFAAVCSPWRAAAARHPRLPAMPLLLPSIRHGKRDREAWAYSPEDGRVLRVPLPWFPWGNRLVGAYKGGWVATLSGSNELLVVNLFSGARAALITTGGASIRKIVFSEDPMSGGCILAAMTTLGIALHKVGCPDSGWTMSWGIRYLIDIDFCNGELLGVTSNGLILFDIIYVDKEYVPGDITDVHIDVAMSPLYAVDLPSEVKYIFELHGKPAIAVEVGPEDYTRKEGHFFRVFELVKNDDTTTPAHQYAWTEVTTLGDHSLFLGPAGCKAVHFSMAGRRGGVEGNHIYYFKQHTYLHNNMECLEKLDIGSCTVHYWENRDKHHMEKVVSRGYHYRKDQLGANGCNGCMWLWPPDF